MSVQRQTKSKCPHCLKDIPAAVVLDDDGCAYLTRTCPEHGEYRFLLSKNGALYADFDRYYFTHLKGMVSSGRLTNYWLFINDDCQMKCAYCEVELDGHYFTSMSQSEFEAAISALKNAKCTLTGGEPSLHPRLLEYIRIAASRNLCVTLATNGVALASRSFCEALWDAGVSEVRLSIESFDKEQAREVGTAEFVDAKLAALENLETLGIPTTLSPTIFKGINENQLIAACEYAKDKAHIRSLSVNGFAYFKGAASLESEHMIMPDAMMDILVEKYSIKSREDMYTFQKYIHTLLHLLNIRVCFYTFLFILVRKKNGLEPITNYVNMNRLKCALNWWQRYSDSKMILMRLAFIPVILAGFKMQSLRLSIPIVKLFFANCFSVKIRKYPSGLLPIVLNTNCSVLSLDATLSKQCMSAILFMRDGQLRESISTEGLMEKEESKYAQNR